MKKIRALFINLPIPDYYSSVQRGNTQLFADYLRVTADPEIVEVLKIPRNILESYNNRALTGIICDLKPDVVGFSSYLWNLERNKEIAGHLRKAGIVTVTGGPEVTTGNAAILAECFDFCFTGAGEQVLNDFLIRLAKGEVMRNPLIKSTVPPDFNAWLPGYLEVTDDYTYDRLFYLEVERGCPFKCIYCAYGKFNERITTITRDIFKQCLEKIYPLELDEIYLLAPTLNRHRQNFHFYLDELIALRRKTGKLLKVFAELRAGLVSDEEITRMAAAGFKEIEFGIQSLHKRAYSPPALDAAGFNFIDFSKKLLAAGIIPAIDFIVGLPHDTYESIIETIELLDKNNLLSYASFYHLHVLPGTQVRKIFDANGYIYDNEPPYLAYEVDTLAFHEIQDVYYYLEEQKNLTFLADFFTYLPEQFYLLAAPADLTRLAATPFYHSASLLMLDNFKSDSLLGFFDNFFKTQPEVFHRLFIYAHNRIDMGFVEALNEICCKYKNYYDLYKDSINFDLSTSFSKVMHVLVKPDVHPGYREELAAHCLVDYLLLPEEVELYGKYEAFFYSSYNREGNYLYLLKDSLPVKAPWIREIPLRNYHETIST